MCHSRAEGGETMTIRVFLADDHSIVREGLRRILEEEDDIIVVGEAENGLDCVKKVRDLCPDVALIDIAMPELNGIEATRKICEVTPVTQVVILSMYSTDEHISRALKAGALGYVLKESIAKELPLAIRAAHAGQRHLSNKIANKIVDDYLRRLESADEQSPLERLSEREREVLQLVAEGNSSSAIADKLSLSPKTVESYRSRLMGKLGLSDVPSLVKFAIRHGLISPD